jgi:hypothetical protein
MAVTTVIVKPATSTITSTLQTAVSTTTVTATGAAPTQTGKLIVKGGSYDQGSTSIYFYPRQPQSR